MAIRRKKTKLIIPAVGITFGKTYKELLENAGVFEGNQSYEFTIQGRGHKDKGFIDYEEVRLNN